MSDMTNYLETELVDHILRNASYTSPAAVYVGLHTASPGEAGSDANEVTGGSYARAAVTFGAPSDGVSVNTETTFVTATASWGTVSHFAIHDALTGGNQLFQKALNSSKTIASGDTAKFSASDLSVTLA